MGVISGGNSYFIPMKTHQPLISDHGDLTLNIAIFDVETHFPSPDCQGRNVDVLEDGHVFDVLRGCNLDMIWDVQLTMTVFSTGIVLLF